MNKDELKQEAEEWVANEIGKKDLRCVRAYIDSAEPREKRIEELEKENAELKKQLEMSNKVYNDNLDYSHHIEVKLTNATDLLKWFVWYFREGSPNLVPYKHKVTDTEHFLNSDVEKRLLGGSNV